MNKIIGIKNTEALTVLWLSCLPFSGKLWWSWNEDDINDNNHNIDDNHNNDDNNDNIDNNNDNNNINNNDNE